MAENGYEIREPTHGRQSPEFLCEYYCLIYLKRNTHKSQNPRKTPFYKKIPPISYEIQNKTAKLIQLIYLGKRI